MFMDCLRNNQEQMKELFKNTLCSSEVFEIIKDKCKSSSRTHNIQEKSEIIKNKCKNSSRTYYVQETKSLWSNQEQMKNS